jgi:hypothetical protein
VGLAIGHYLARNEPADGVYYRRGNLLLLTPSMGTMLVVYALTFVLSIITSGCTAWSNRLSQEGERWGVGAHII